MQHAFLNERRVSARWSRENRATTQNRRGVGWWGECGQNAENPYLVCTVTLATQTGTWSELKQLPIIGPLSIMEAGIENVHVNR